MAMRKPQVGYRRRGARDGVGFIWFTLLALPFLMLSLAMSTDFARLVMVGHQMRNVADAGAIAAAWQIDTGTVVLNKQRSAAAAHQTVCRYTSHVPGVSANPNMATSPECAHPITLLVTFSDPNHPTPDSPGVGDRSATVAVEYRVNGLIFPAYFGFGSRFVDGVATKKASVCVPGDGEQQFTRGMCDRAIVPR